MLSFFLLALLSPFDWQPMGPERGSVTAIAPSGPLFAGTAEGRLFRWETDRWLEAGAFPPPIRAIVDHGSHAWVHAGTDLYRSGILVTSAISSFAVAPSNAQVVYAATDVAIGFTTDGGDTWHWQQGGAVSIDADAANSAMLWAARADGSVAKSMDGGATWTAVSAITEPIVSIDAHPSRPGVAYAIGRNGKGFRTLDGDRWSPLYYLTGRLVFDPDNDRHFFAIEDSGRLFHSDDDGDWLDTIHGGPILSVAKRDGVLYAGFREDGVMRSDDGGHTWRPDRSGLLAAEIRSLAASRDASVVYAGSVSSMFKSTDGGATWENVFTLRLLPGPFSAIAIDRHDSDRVWIGAGISAWYSGDGGVRFNRLFWLPEKEGQTVESLSFAPDDARAVLLLMSRSFFRLETEPLRLVDRSPGTQAGDAFEALAVHGNSIWIGGTRGGHALLLHSTDGGQTWQDQSPGTPGSIKALQVTPSGRLVYREGAVALGSQGDTILAAGPGGIFASQDGMSWRDVTGSLRDEQVTTLTSGDFLFAGTAAGGVFARKPLSLRRRAAHR